MPESFEKFPRTVNQMRAEIGVEPWSCWVTYHFDCNSGEVVDGVYPTELEALRQLNNDYYLKAKQVFAGEVREQLQ